MKPRILLIGKNGQVGSDLAQLLGGVAELTAVGRSEVDLSKADDIRRVIAQSHPHAIINAAAYTGVDQAEQEEPLARAINAEAPAIMAEETKKLGALLIHYSTDYVFNGTKRSPYTEADATNPLNAYGRTKLAGEEAIRASGPAHLILRTAWVYATSGKNFLLTILRLASTREELRIVNDQFGAPTTAREIASATTRLLWSAQVTPAAVASPCGFNRPARAPSEPLDGSAGPAPAQPAVVIPTEASRAARGEAAGPLSPSSRDALQALASRSGTYHLTAAGQTTWYEFAVAILDECSRLPAATPWLAAATSGRLLIAKRIIPIETKDYPTPARRPAYSVLSNARFADTFGFALADWRSQLANLVRLNS